MPAPAFTYQMLSQLCLVLWVQISGIDKQSIMAKNWSNRPIDSHVCRIFYFNFILNQPVKLNSERISHNLIIHHIMIRRFYILYIISITNSRWPTCNNGTARCGITAHTLKTTGLHRNNSLELSVKRFGTIWRKLIIMLLLFVLNCDLLNKNCGICVTVYSMPTCVS